MASLNAKVYRLFGKSSADVFLCKNKRVSAGALCVATVVWILFDVLKYHLLTVLCSGLILGLTTLFLWPSDTTFINNNPFIPEVSIPEGPAIKFASAFIIEINRAFAHLRNIALRKDLRKFLSIITGLCTLAILGSCCDLLTLLYTITVALFTVPPLYDKYETKVPVGSCPREQGRGEQTEDNTIHEDVTTLERVSLETRKNLHKLCINEVIQVTLYPDDPRTTLVAFEPRLVDAINNPWMWFYIHSRGKSRGNDMALRCLRENDEDNLPHYGIMIKQKFRGFRIRLEKILIRTRFINGYSEENHICRKFFLIKFKRNPTSSIKPTTLGPKKFFWYFSTLSLHYIS